LTNLTERQLSEAEFHDKWAETVDLSEVDPDITFEAVTAIESQFILSKMGDIQGKRILDLGCGYGESAVYFAKKGAVVSACDISPNFVDLAKKLAEMHNTSIQADACPSEALPYPDASFDYVFANGVLHHVDILYRTASLQSRH
jgi:2-polyprenyl-3-methyl-5-hydroxy-6-metoxy-1,4-benzoquinol methylase